MGTYLGQRQLAHKRRGAHLDNLPQLSREVKRSGQGVRIVSCLLPKKSPWLNPIEAKWVHGKRRVVEPDGLLTAHELAERICAAFDCTHYEHLSIAENAA